MTLKRTFTAVLLAFVAVSVAWAIAKETGAFGDRGSSTGIEDALPALGPPGARKVVVFFLHGKVRCPTCRGIEEYAKEAVMEGFPDDVRSSRLEWRIVDVDEPGGTAFVKTFQILTSSVVLALVRDGKVEDWRNLSRVWELEPDKEAFLKYVRGEARGFVGRLGS